MLLMEDTLIDHGVLLGAPSTTFCLPEFRISADTARKTYPSAQ